MSDLVASPAAGATIFLADSPITPPQSAPTLVFTGTADLMVWRQTFVVDGVNVVQELQYIGDFASGTVTEIKGLTNDVVTLHWTGFSTSLAALNEADITPGGWEQFYRTVLLPGDDLITTTRHLNEDLNGYSGNDTIQSGPGNDHLEGGVGSDYLRGADGDDSIAGGDDFDDINGNKGADTIQGGGGNDWVLGGQDSDLLFGNAGADVVYGNLGADTGDGGSGEDVVRGGQGDDLLAGGDGNDWLSGDRGADTLTGGTGADIFHTFGDAELDRVTDFNLAEGDRVLVDAGTTFTVSQSGADTVIDMSGGGRMVLVGVSMASLSGDWIFTG